MKSLPNWLKVKSTKSRSAMSLARKEDSCEGKSCSKKCIQNQDFAEKEARQRNCILLCKISTKSYSNNARAQGKGHLRANKLTQLLERKIMMISIADRALGNRRARLEARDFSEKIHF